MKILFTNNFQSRWALEPQSIHPASCNPRSLLGCRCVGDSWSSAGAAAPSYRDQSPAKYSPFHVTLLLMTFSVNAKTVFPSLNTSYIFLLYTSSKPNRNARSFWGQYPPSLGLRFHRLQRVPGFGNMWHALRLKPAAGDKCKKDFSNGMNVNEKRSPWLGKLF